jgi:transposase
LSWKGGVALQADDKRGVRWGSRKHQKEKRSMKHHAGLDVSVKETSVCIVDENGKICREMKVASHPEDLARALNDPAWSLERVGLEAGPLSQWLFSGLAEVGLPVVCIETRHTKAFLTAQVNKSDRNDARGIAQMMRVNLFRPVHVKTLTSQRRRALLTARKLLQEKAIAIDNDIRGLLRNFGLKVGPVGASKFEARIRELVEGMPELAEIIEPLLKARRKLRELFATLHRKLLAIVREDTVCRRLMTVPGVGPVVSMAFAATVDIPARFKNSKAVGAALGLTPVLNQSGESKRIGRISLCGDGMTRTLLYEAAQVMLTRATKWSWLKAWAMKVVARRGMQKAIVALARRLAVILHRMWVSGTDFRWTRDMQPTSCE